MSDDFRTVDDYMTRDPVTFQPADDIHQALRVLLDRRISGAPVVESDRLVGMLSKKDCMKVVYSAAYHGEWGGRVDQYMNSPVQTIDSGTGIIAAADRFIESRFHRFPVVSDGRMVGLLGRHDVLRAIEDHWSSV